MDPSSWEKRQADRAARFAERTQARADRFAERAQARAERHRERMERWQKERPAGGLIFGVLVITVGVLFLLRNLGIVYFDNLWQYWPVILIAWGLSKLLDPQSSSTVVSGVILTGIGSLFLLSNLGILGINVWQLFWPVLLIGWGAMMLAGHLDRMEGGESWWGGVEGDPPPPPAGGEAQPEAPGAGTRRLYVDVIFGGMERRIASQEFEGGKISAVFGGVKIDLRRAGTKLPEIVLKADAVFGGIELWVPDTWETEVRGAGVFGAYEDRTHPPVRRPEGGEPPRLIVKGGAVFGGVTVRN